MTIGTTTFDANKVYNTTNTTAKLGQGGAIYNKAGANLTINLSTIKNSSIGIVRGTSYGGAIFNQGNATLNAVDFISNQLGSYGGAIYNEAGAQLDIYGSTFTSNAMVANGQGGAIKNLGTLNVNFSLFEENTALGGNGGAIFSQNTSSIVNIIGSDFLNNTAIRAGALQAEYSTVKISSSLFEGNKTITTDDKRVAQGGALHLERGSGTIDSSIFKGNQAVLNAGFTTYSAEGGAVLVAFGTYDITGSVFDSNSSISDEKALAGALIVYNGNTISTVSGSIFTNNTATARVGMARGGAIYNMGTLTLKNSVLSGNASYSGRYADWGGGALGINGGITTISGTIFDSNTTTGAGGAIIAIGSNDLDITGSLFSNNIAGYGGGGAIQFYELNNLAGTLNVSMSKFSGNSVNVENSDGNDDGGAIQSDKKLIITGTTFRSNSVSGLDDSANGGAIWHDSTGSADRGMTITDSIFSNNSAPQAFGGAVTAYSGYTTITNTSFVENT